VICYLVLKKLFLSSESDSELKLDYCKAELKKLGPFSYEESVVSSIFGLLILAWFTSRDIPFGSFEFKGWLNLLPESSYVKESTLAMLAAFSLFLIPSKDKKSKILEWKDTQKIPIGILFLFGGGFALAKGVDQSGLSEIIATQLQFVSSLPVFTLLIILALFMTFFTELTSNTSSTVLLLPLLASLLSALDASPAQVLFTVTISASCAFMLPMATPPNTIVFSSEKLSIKDMMRAGIWLNLIAALLISTYMYFVLPLVFGT